MNNLFTKHSSLIAASLLVLMFFLGLASLWNDSGTTDEVAHIPAGYSYLKFRDFRLNPEHPPLLKALACIPLLFMDLKFPQEHIAWQENNQWETGWEFIYRAGNNADKMLLWSRIPILLLAILLGVYVFSWTRKVFGKKTALIALFFYVFSPNILAHSRLVTTDLGVTATFFITLYYFYKFIKHLSWRYLIYSGLAFGVAQLVKFSNILLFIYMTLLTLVIIFIYREKITFKFPLAKLLKKEWLKRAYVFIGSLTLVFLIGILLIGIIYQIFISGMPLGVQHNLINSALPGEGVTLERNLINTLADNPITRPYSHYLLGLKMVFMRVAGGNTTYFLGETSNQGWWYYYPVSFLIKTPLPMLILFIVSIFGLLMTQNLKTKVPAYRQVDKSSKLKTAWLSIRNFIDKNLLEFIAWSVVVAFFVIGIKSNLNIGLRHILPLYPFMFILCAKYFVKFFTSAPRILTSFGIVLLIWYALSNLLAFPSYLAYFNEFVGQKNAYKYTVDSNLDWGQDLKRLSYWVEENNIDKITVDYFGGSVPEYYMPGKTIEWHSRYGKPEKGWFAVSATYYQNSKWYKKVLGEPDYSWLDKLKPKKIIGGSILVYYIE